jgi:pimeloyl-ACP methyl ester carboxylesterase
MPYVHVRGVEVYYEESGSGPHPLLIAHGLFGSVSSAASFAADLTALGCHVFRYDARGHGRSGYTTRSQDYYRNALAEDMCGFIDALGLERVSIYGSSMGVGTALMLAISHPNRVSRLVLRSPPAFGKDARPAQRTMGKLAFLYRHLGASATAGLVSLIRGRRAGEMPEILRSQRAVAIVPAIKGLLIEGPPFPVDDLPKITAPALILAHENDKLHPRTAGELLKDNLRSAELDVVADVDFWKRNPKILAHRVADFVRA